MIVEQRDYHVITGKLNELVQLYETEGIESLWEVAPGRGRKPVDWIAAVIASRDRSAAGPTAPPHGLFLVRVDYGDTLVSGS